MPPERNEGGMKFGDFLFPDSRDPECDGSVIAETITEAKLAQALGIDVVWLAEHHFDGICAYADPIAFAGALAPSLTRAALGFAVVQVSLHHPIRLAEQIALFDHLLQGRLVVGLGRGSSYNIYDYQGFGIDHHEAQERLDEAEAIMVKAWTGSGFAHHGRYWDLEVPLLRPRPYTKPHPKILRAASTEASLLALARQGKPFLMNVQPPAVTRRRVDLYRRTMREAGADEEKIERNLAECWVWRNIFVAASDAEAERVGAAAFRTMTAARAELRNRIWRETGLRIAVPENELPDARANLDADLHGGVICGAPATVAERIAEIAALGIGGIIATFRLGPMPHEQAMASLELFMRQVAPQFRSPPLA
jgi:alkanesulfonate monooxygenase SsuD/methylene tetrahydromethanopterin reductase-like flavin-dependent oxidoreductase (luciferase family)